MRRGIKNDKVIKAITLGLATMMALSNPVSVYAADEDVLPQPETAPADIEGGVADEAQTANDSAQDSVEAAAESVDTVVNDISDNVAASDTTNGAAVSDERFGVDVNKIIEANNNIPEVGITDEISTNLIIAETAAQTVAADAEAAKENVSAAESVADNAKKEAEAAVSMAQNYSETIVNAKTMKEAQEAYDALTALINDTQTSLDEKQANYNNLKTAYDEAAKNIALLEATYNLAVATASDNADAAAANLAAAQTVLNTLRTQLGDAKAAVDAYSNKALSIIDAQETVKDNKSVNWGAEDKVMIAILKNYYLPEIENVKADDVKIDRIIGIDGDSYNYFKVTYTDENGETAYKYYNYSMDGSSKNKIVIYEKRENEVKANDAEEKAKKDNTEALLYTDGIEVDSYKYASGTSKDSFTQEEFDKAVDDKNIVSFDGKTIKAYTDGEIAYMKGDTEETGLPDGTAAGKVRDAEKGETTVTEISDKKTSYVIDDKGNVHEQVKQDVTVFTYTDKSFSSSKDYATEDDAIAAAEAKAAEEMKDTDKDFSVETTKSTEYRADTTYVPLFDETIKESETNTYWDGFIIHQDPQKENMKKLMDKINLYMVGNMYISKEDGSKRYILTAQCSKPDTEVVEDYLIDHFLTEYKTTVTISVKAAKVETVVGGVDLEILNNYGYNDNPANFDSAMTSFLEAKNNELGDSGKYYYYNCYYDEDEGVIVTDTVKTEISSATAASREEAEQQSRNGISNGRIDGETNVEEVNKYGYVGSYLSLDDTASETYTVEDTEYKKLKGVVEQNKNFKNGNIALDEDDDESFNIFLNQASEEKKAAQDKYDRLISETEKAQQDVTDAENDVSALQDEINKLKKNAPDNSEELKKLEARLKTAEANLEAVNEKLDSLKDDLSTAGDELKKTRIRLTPALVEKNNENEEFSSEGGTSAPAAVISFAAGDAAAPIALSEGAAASVAQTVIPGVAGARVNQNEQLGDTVNEGRADALTKKETVEEADVKAAKTSDTKDTAVIADEVVPLSAIPDEDKAQMNWWWLVVAALLGTTGYSMYKNHEKKAREKAALKEEVEKEN